jgi:hypothetical protein
MALAGAVAAAMGLSGVSYAQSVSPGSNAPNLDGTGRPVTQAPEGTREAPRGVQVNPSPMIPGSRAGDAPGMQPSSRADGGPAGTTATDPGNPARGADVTGGNRAGTAGTGAGATGAGATGSGATGSGAMTPGAGTATATPPSNAGSPTTGTPAADAVTPGNPANQRGPAQAQGTAAPDTQVSPGTAPTTVQPGQAAGALPGATQPADPGAARPGSMVQRQAPDGTTTTTAPPAAAEAPPAAAAPPPAAAAVPPAGDTATGSRTPAGAAESGGSRAVRTEGQAEGAPLSGANSFTEGQARSRITDAGFADVQELRLDERGVWRGRGMRNGQQVGVSMDYQGNIVAGQ